MGGVSPETCWALYKYEINFDTLLHLVGFLYELYYDARIHEHQNHLEDLLVFGRVIGNRLWERGGWPKCHRNGFSGMLSHGAINPLSPELNPVCYLLALLAHHFLHVSRIRVKLLTFSLLMSYIYIYIYMEHPFLMFLDHTQRRSTVGRTPLVVP